MTHLERLNAAINALDNIWDNIKVPRFSYSQEHFVLDVIRERFPAILDELRAAHKGFKQEQPKAEQ